MERLPDLGALQTDQWNFLQEQMSRLVQAWKEGDPGELEPFLPPPQDVLRAITLQELIITDLEMRWRNQQHVSLDYYVGKYPELGNLADLPTKLIYEEFRIRQRHGDLPHLQSYRRRFPRQFSELELLLEQQPPPPPVKEVLSTPTNTFSGSGTMPTQNPIVNGYKLLRRLASGAFADVYEAEAPGGVRVAIKVIRQPLTNEDAKRELEALEVFKSLRHSCLLEVHAIFIHQDQLYVAMGLADCTLRDRLQDFRDAGAHEGGLPGIPPRELLAYFRDAAEALDYLHSEKVLHRDVKPANILLFKAKRVRAAKPGAADGFQARARLADFGLAKLVESQRLDASGGGTLAYMAPEACRNRTNPQSDLYSLAASYAELRLGRPLFPYTNLYDLTRAHLEETPDLAPLPLGEQKVLLRALAKDPDDRFPTCQQFVSALEEVLPLPSRPSSATSHSVAGHRLARLIGGGTRGESWEAVAPDGTHVALTVIRNLPWAQAVEEHRTLQFLRGVRHPNLARLHDAFLLGEQNTVLSPDSPPPSGSATVSLCLIRELLTENLGQRLDRYEKGIPTRELIGYMWQAAEGLDALRGPYPVESPPPSAAADPEPVSRWPWARKPQPTPEAVPETVTVVHAAVSPRSLFAEGPTIKVGDFALVKLVHSTQGLLPGDETLLPGYVPPELYQKQAHANSDQYSLAITYVELRTGRPPFRSTAPASLMAEQKEGKLNLKRLPDAERDVLKRATALNPAERYPSCREFVAALEEARFTSGIRTASRPEVVVDKPKPAAAPATVAPPAVPTVVTPVRAADSGEFVLQPAALATAPHAAPLVGDETIGGNKLAALKRDVLEETMTGPELPALPAAKPKPAAVAESKANDEVGSAKKTEDVARTDRSGPAAKTPAPSGKRRGKKGLGKKLLATGVALAVVVGGAALAFKFFPSNGPTQTAEYFRELIKAGEFEQVSKKLGSSSASNELPKEVIQELHDENKKAWLAFCLHEYKEKPSDTMRRLKEMRVSYPNELGVEKHIVQLEEAIQQLSWLSNQGELAVRAKHKPYGNGIALMMEELPGGKSAAAGLRGQIARLGDGNELMPLVDVTKLLSQLRDSEGAKARPIAEEIKKVDSKNAEALRHLAVLDAIAEMEKGVPPSPGKVGIWVTQLQDPLATPRLEELLAALAVMADKDEGVAGRIAKELRGLGGSPSIWRGFLYYLRGLGEAHNNQLKDAADQFLSLLGQNKESDHVLSSEHRRGRVGSILARAATGLRTKGTFDQPFGRSPEEAERAYQLLTRADPLLPPDKPGDKAEADMGLILSAWHRKGRTPSDAEVDRKRSTAFLARIASSEEAKLELDLEWCAFHMVHARLHAATTSEKQEALESYAKVLDKLGKPDTVKGHDAGEVYGELVRPALELAKQIPTPVKDQKLRKVTASIFAAQARLLRDNLRASWHGLSESNAMQEVLGAFERAVQIDRTPGLVADKIRAYLEYREDALPVSVRVNAEWLTKELPETASSFALYARILRREVTPKATSAKQIGNWVLLRDIARAGLDLCEKLGDTDEDKVALTSALQEVESEVRQMRYHGISHLQNKDYTRALDWAKHFRTLDSLIAARTAGLALNWLGKVSDARLEFEKELDKAKTPGNPDHIYFRKEYLDVLNRLVIAKGALGEPPTSAQLMENSNSLVGLLEFAPELLEDQAIRDCRGRAYGAAGIGYTNAADGITQVEARRKVVRQGISMLEKAMKDSPKHAENRFWRPAYGNLAVNLHSLEKNKDSIEICERAILRLQEAIKADSGYHQLLDPGTKTQMEKDLESLKKIVKAKK